MAFKISSLWKYPEVNPINRKARSIPLLNPINQYGRVFHCAWFGFFVAFWSWYAFPPLLALTIGMDINASKQAQQNSNILGITGTLIIRVISGPLCDRFGPRYVFAGVLLIGSLPTFCAGGIYNEAGLVTLRFFLGLIGGAFVPCQVWSTGFFDKNVVGTANALTAGLGNAGGGVTYFLMPAIFDSLVHKRHLSPHAAWRVAFVVPGIIIVFMAIVILTCCPDTPTGKWADRHLAAKQDLAAHGINPAIVDVHGDIDEKAHSAGGSSPERANSEKALDTKEFPPDTKVGDHEAAMTPDLMVETAQGEIVQKPSLKEAMKVIFSLPTLTVAACYFCTFGTELSVNGILGNYYFALFPALGQTGTGSWAAMFGLLNVVFRPMGGMLSDFMYVRTHNLWLRKAWLTFLGVVTGAFMLAIGLTNPHNQSTMFGLVAGLAFFLEAANGANFSLVPHVHPYANGKFLDINQKCKDIMLTHLQVSSRVSLVLPETWAVSASPLCSGTSALRLRRNLQRASGSLVSWSLASTCWCLGSGPFPRARLAVTNAVIYMSACTIMISELFFNQPLMRAC